MWWGLGRSPLVSGSRGQHDVRGPLMGKWQGGRDVRRRARRGGQGLGPIRRFGGPAAPLACDIGTQRKAKAIRKPETS
jgi:hypothetical protein